MDPRQRPDRSQSRMAYQPGTELLEDRRLPSGWGSSSSSQVALVQHYLHAYMGELQHLELKSHATVAEYQALRDDARAITAEASATSLGPAVAQTKALAVTLQLDRAPLDGSFGNLAWQGVAGKLSTNLNGLGVSPELITRTIADMKATADSAGVSAHDYATLAFDANRLRHGEHGLRNSYTHFPSPGLYYSQHLRGFFRGAAAERKANLNALHADVRSIQASANATPSEAAALHRDVRLLRQVGAALTSVKNEQFGNSYTTTFAQGLPGAAQQAQFQASATTILDGTATPGLLGKVNQLSTDAPTFFPATGSSQANIARIVADVQAVVADGVASGANPFKVQFV